MAETVEVEGLRSKHMTFLVLVIFPVTNKHITLYAAHYPILRSPSELQRTPLIGNVQPKVCMDPSKRKHLWASTSSVDRTVLQQSIQAERWSAVTQHHLGIRAWRWLTDAEVGGKKAIQVTSSNRITVPLKAAGQAHTEPTRTGKWLNTPRTSNYFSRT